MSQLETVLGPWGAFFFSAGATLKFISEVVQPIRKYKGKSDGGFAVGGHCDLASMCSDASRAHLLCGPTWESCGGGVVDLAFTFVFERAKQISSSTAKCRYLV